MAAKRSVLMHAIKEVVGVVNKDLNGTLDYFVSNAGRNRFMPLLDEDMNMVKKLYDTNVWAPLQLVQAYAPLVIQPKGATVLNTPVSGYLNVPWQGIYATSKRSLEILGEPLRVEPAPFNVKVVSIVTGAVESKVQSHYQEWKMPETSRYLAIEESFTKRAKGDDGAPRMNNHKYAEAVVAKLIGSPGPKFWYGAAVDIVKFAVPNIVVDLGLLKSTVIDIMLKEKQ